MYIFWGPIVCTIQVLHILTYLLTYMVFIEILQNQAEHSAGERNFWKKEKDSVKFPDSRSVSLISIFSLF